MKTVERVSYDHPILESSSFLAILETFDSTYCVECSHGPGGKLLSRRFVRVHNNGDIQTISDLPVRDNARYEMINENTLLITRFVHTPIEDSLLENVSLYDVDNAKEINLFSNAGYAHMTRDKRFLVISNPSRDVKESDLYELKGFVPQRIGYCPRDEFRYSLLSNKSKPILTLSPDCLFCNTILSYDPATDQSDTVYYDTTLTLYSAEATYNPDYILVRAYKHNELDSLLKIVYSRTTFDETEESREYKKRLTDHDIVDGYYAKWRLLNIKTGKMRDIDLHAYWPYMSKDKKSVFFVLYDNGVDRIYNERWRVVSLEDMVNDK